MIESYDNHILFQKRNRNGRVEKIQIPPSYTVDFPKLYLSTLK